MSFESNIKSNDLRKEIQSRLKRAATVAGRAASHRVAEEVRRRIPNRGGWYLIYRDAIDYKEDPSELRWTVDGLADVKLSALPADETLVDFEGKDQPGAVLQPYNPWPLDLIPTLVGGYKDSIVTRMAGEGAAEAARERITPLLEIIRTQLADIGADLGNDATILVIGGKIYADIAFLARRLELGYSGFPHIPHWSIAIANARSDMGKWLTQGKTAAEINKIINGG